MGRPLLVAGDKIVLGRCGQNRRYSVYGDITIGKIYVVIDDGSGELAFMDDVGDYNYAPSCYNDDVAGDAKITKIIE